MLKHLCDKRIRRAFWICATVLVMAVIFCFSGQGKGASENVSDRVADVFGLEQAEERTRVSNQPLFLGLTLRKIAHVVVYCTLGFCLYQALEGARRRAAWAVGGAYVYGVLDELHQHLVGRGARWQDTLIDLAGICMGVGLALALPRLGAAARRRLRLPRGDGRGGDAR